MTSSTTLIQYIYDPLDRVLGHQLVGEATTLRFYKDDQIVLQARPLFQRRFLRDGARLLAQSDHSSSDIQVALLGTDQQGSVSHALTGGERKDCVYAPYGTRPAPEGIEALMGYNGQLPDPVTGCYLLGNGQRVYNPGLMRFHSPDSMSPFGAGGINPYAYCLGDPINLIDPTGHFSWKSILGIGIALVSIALTVATFGSAAPLTGPAMVAAVLNIGSDLLDIASTLAEELAPDSKAGAVLGQLSMALSVGSFAAKQIGKRAAIEAGRNIGEYSGKSLLTRQGAIKVTNARPLQGFKGAAGLTKIARNTVVIGERLEKATDVLNYIDYAFAAVKGVDDYVLPYLNPPQAGQQSGGSSLDELSGTLNPSGLQASVDIEFAAFLHDEANRSRDIRTG